MNVLGRLALGALKAYARVAPTQRGGYRMVRVARRLIPRSQWRGAFVAPGPVTLTLDLSTYPDCCMACGLYESDTLKVLRKLLRAGANRVVSPYQIGAVQMAQTAIRPAVVDFVELATNSDNLELAMEEITVAESSSLANQSILDANLRQRFGIIVVAIQRQDLRMEFNPEPDTAIRAGDKLVVLGRPHSLRRLEVEAAA